MKSVRLAVLLSISLLEAFGVEQSATGVMGQPGFRVRSAFNAPLNADQGWAGALNEDVTVYADRPFRIRFEAEAPASSTASQFRLQYRRNGGEWSDVEAHDFPKPDSDDAKRPGSASLPVRRTRTAPQPRTFSRARAWRSNRVQV